METAIEDATASERKAKWEFPVLKGRPEEKDKRDILAQRGCKEKRDKKEIRARRVRAARKETGGKWACQDSQELTEFTVFKGLPVLGVHVVVTATMERRESLDAQVSRDLRDRMECRGNKVLRVRKELRRASASRVSREKPADEDAMDHRDFAEERDRLDLKATLDRQDHLVDKDLQVCPDRKVTWELDMKEPKEKLVMWDQVGL